MPQFIIPKSIKLISYKENHAIHPRDLDKILKKVDNRLSVWRFGYPEVKYHGYTARVFFNHIPVCSIPAGYIYWRRIKDYNDWNPEHKYLKGVDGKMRTEKSAVPHRSIQGLIQMLRGYLPNYKINKFISLVRNL